MKYQMFQSKFTRISQTSIDHLQLVQNAAARFLTGTG